MSQFWGVYNKLIGVKVMSLVAKIKQITHKSLTSSDRAETMGKMAFETVFNFEKAA